MVFYYYTYYIITVLWQLTIVSSWLFLILCNPWHGLSDTLNWDWDLLPAWWVPWSAPRLQLVSALGTPGPPSGNGVTLARNHEEINPIRDAEPLSNALLSEKPVLAETSILVSDFYEKKKIRRRKRWYCRICFSSGRIGDCPLWLLIPFCQSKIRIQISGWLERHVDKMVIGWLR